MKQVGIKHKPGMNLSDWSYRQKQLIYLIPLGFYTYYDSFYRLS